MVAKVSSDFQKQVAGYGLTTAEILYRRPDYTWLLQSYVWQDYDIAPRFPVLTKFLNFWEKGCKYFYILGPDHERLEFCQILK